jgi:hypothetical protein
VSAGPLLRPPRLESTTLAELANVGASVASNRANAMTGTVAHLTGGATVD